MKVNYDIVADAVYFKLGEGRVAKTIKMEDRFLMDVDGSGNVLGIEILDASSQQNLVENLKLNVASGVPISITEDTPLAIA